MTTQQDVYKVLGHIRKEFIGPDTWQGRVVYISPTHSARVKNGALGEPWEFGNFDGKNKCPWNPFSEAKYKPSENEKEIVATWKEQKENAYWNYGKSKNIKKVYAYGIQQLNSIAVKNGLYITRHKNGTEIPLLYAPMPGFLMDRKETAIWTNWNRCKWLIKELGFSRVLLIRTGFIFSNPTQILEGCLRIEKQKEYSFIAGSPTIFASKVYIDGHIEKVKTC